MSITPADAAKNHRRMKRRLPKRGTGVACRKGTLGLGPNLGIRLQDICEDGARLLVKSLLKKGDEIELSITPPGFSKSLVVAAIVQWCGPNNEGEGFWVGARFRTVLSYSQMIHLI